MTVKNKPEGLAELSVLAVDIGSSSIKTALIDADGRSLAKGRIPLPSVSDGERVEIDGDRLWAAFTEAVKMVLSSDRKLPQPSAMCITSQMAGLVLLDERRLAVRPFILSIDRRGTPFVTKLKQLFGSERIHLETGCPPAGIYPAAKLLCLAEEEPCSLRRTRFAGGIKEYVVWKLTGNWVTDPGSASATQMYAQARRQWWPEMIQTVGLADAVLPKIRNPEAIAGKVMPEVSRNLKLPGGIPVFVGTGDGPAANLSTGSVTKRQLCVSLGTTAVVRYLTDHEERPLTGLCYFRQHFGGNMYFQGFRLEDAGSRIDEMFLHPQNEPQLQDVLDDILFQLYDAIKPVLEQGRFHEIRPMGGGTANERLMKDMADLFRLPVVMTEGGDSTLGAAMIIVKRFMDPVGWDRIAERMVRKVKVFEPAAGCETAVQQRYEAYKFKRKGGRRTPPRPLSDGASAHNDGT